MKLGFDRDAGSTYDQEGRKNKNGKLVGLMFNAPMYSDHPPFGGSVKEYKTYFSALFNYKYFEPAYNSISSRNGKELFVNLIKK